MTLSTIYLKPAYFLPVRCLVAFLEFALIKRHETTPPNQYPLSGIYPNISPLYFLDAQRTRAQASMEQSQGDAMSTILDKLQEVVMYIVMRTAMWVMGDTL